MLAAALAAALLIACDQPADTPAPQAPSAEATRAANTAPGATDPATQVADTAMPATVADPAASEAEVDKAIDEKLGDHAAYRQLMEDFQKAVSAQDADAASALVRYPISVEIAGKRKPIEDAAEFVRNYRAFMTPQIAKAITDTRYGEVMVNYKGVMLGQGEAWINGICRDKACKNVEVQVIAIQAGPGPSP